MRPDEKPLECSHFHDCVRCVTASCAWQGDACQTVCTGACVRDGLDCHRIGNQTASPPIPPRGPFRPPAAPPLPAHSRAWMLSSREIVGAAIFVFMLLPMMSCSRAFVARCRRCCSGSAEHRLTARRRRERRGGGGSVGGSSAWGETTLTTALAKSDGASLEGEAEPQEDEEEAAPPSYKEAATSG